MLLPMGRVRLLWLLSTIVALCIFGGSLWIFLSLRLFVPVAPRSFSSVREAPSSPCDGHNFCIAGADVLQSVAFGARFLALQEEIDANENLLWGLLRGWFAEAISAEPPVEEFLAIWGESPFLFLLEPSTTESGVRWVFTVAQGGEESEVLLQKLHEGFAKHLPQGIVRERTMPSGAIQRDITSGIFRLVETEEKVQGFSLRGSADRETQKAFFSASDRKRTLLSNDRTLLLEALDVPLSAQDSLSLSVSGLSLLSSWVPQNDVLRAAKALLADDQESYLSLSSWQCIPYNTAAFPPLFHGRSG